MRAFRNFCALRRESSLLPGLPLLLALAAPNALAEIHDVAVGDNFFDPNDLTIQAGDTVRWTYAPTGGGSCGPYGGCDATAHTVTSDDGLFSSGSPSSNFEFDYTFGDPGEYRYFCEQHSQAGRDIDAFMNGRIVVEGSQGLPAFQIDSGLNDAWFNPATPGQGFFITVFPDIGQMFVAWFTYDIERPDDSIVAQLGEPGHRWITAFGPYADHEAVLDVEITTGGVFDAAEPMPAQHADGTLTLQFEGCNAGTVSYDIPSLSLQGNVPIERIAHDNLPACEAAN